MTKLCRTCRVEKTLAEFPAGKGNQCTVCKDAYRRVTAPPTMVEQVLALPPAKMDGVSGEQRLENAVGARMAMYQEEGWDALRALAKMPISQNSAMNQIKFMAANRLIGAGASEEGSAPPSGGLSDMLKTLNEKYHTTAPKIRSIRERVVDFEQGDAAA